MNRPKLVINLGGPDGNVFMLVGKARELLTGHMLEHFNEAIGEAIVPGSGVTYKGILAIVNTFVQIADTSGLYPEYAAGSPEQEPMNEAQVMAAIQRLNEQLLTLPDTTPCSLEGLYPEFDNPDYGPDMYLVLVEEEIKRVEKALMQHTESQDEPLQRLRSMLLECAIALRRAGV